MLGGAVIPQQQQAPGPSQPLISCGGACRAVAEVELPDRLAGGEETRVAETSSIMPSWQSTPAYLVGPGSVAPLARIHAARGRRHQFASALHRCVGHGAGPCAPAAAAPGAGGLGLGSSRLGWRDRLLAVAPLGLDAAAAE